MFVCSRVTVIVLKILFLTIEHPIISLILNSCSLVIYRHKRLAHAGCHEGSDGNRAPCCTFAVLRQFRGYCRRFSGRWRRFGNVTDFLDSCLIDQMFVEQMFPAVTFNNFIGAHYIYIYIRIACTQNEVYNISHSGRFFY